MAVFQYDDVMRSVSEILGAQIMRITGFAVAGALLIASSALASEKDPVKVSELAGSFGGLAESCGLFSKAYDNRVKKLLRYLVSHRDGGYSESERHIAGYIALKKEAYKLQLSQRTIDCMDVKREFENLWINRPGWTVKIGWNS